MRGWDESLLNARLPMVSKWNDISPHHLCMCGSAVMLLEGALAGHVVRHSLAARLDTLFAASDGLLA